MGRLKVKKCQSMRIKNVFKTISNKGNKVN